MKMNMKCAIQTTVSVKSDNKRNVFTFIFIKTNCYHETFKHETPSRGGSVEGGIIDFPIVNVSSDGCNIYSSTLLRYNFEVHLLYLSTFLCYVLVPLLLLSTTIYICDTISLLLLKSNF